MRERIVQELLADPDVAAIVGTRVYGRSYLLGSVSQDATPDAFDGDGDLLATLVVVLEARTSRDAAGGSPDALVATQGVAVWALHQRDYAVVKAALRAVRARLHRARGLQPVLETELGWSQTVWTDTTPETLDPALQVPAMASRFACTVIERLT